jgi:GAF domain-containing protein
MYDHALFLRTVSRFSGQLLEPYDVDAVLGDVMRACTEVFGLAGAGLALAEEGALRRTIGYPEQVSALEQVQQEQQAGPCVDAFHSGAVVVIDRLSEHADRWPAYCRIAADLGLTSVVGVPLQLSGNLVGAVDLYSVDRRDWPEDDLRAAQVLSDMVTAFLVNASKLRQQEQLAEQLQQALDSRTVIEQAKGVVAESKQIGVDQAFELIRRHARTHHVTVRAVSEAIVQLGLRL